MAENRSVLDRIFPKANKRNRRRLALFSICLLCSFLFWLISTFSKKYTFVISATLAYEHIPPDKALENDPARKVLLTIEGTGWQFLFSKINVLYFPLKIDMRKLRKNTIYLREHYTDLVQQLDPKIRIVNSFPDTLHYTFARKLVKKVPVELLAEITFQKQFYYRDPVRVLPDSITISGPELEIMQIDKWPTRKVSLLNLNKDVAQQIPLAANPHGHIELSATDVELRVPVEQYTEWSVERPIKLRGNKKDYDIHLLPRSCRIFYQVGLSRFYKVNPEMFDIQVDFLQASNGIPLDVQLERVPAFVKSVKVVPDKINYVIIR